MKKQLAFGAAIIVILLAAFFQFRPEEEPSEPVSPSPSPPVPAPPVEPEPVKSSDEPIELSRETQAELRQLMQGFIEKSHEASTEETTPKETLKSSDVPEDNGFHYFLLASEKIRALGGDVYSVYERLDKLRAQGWPDDPELLKLLESYQKAFDLMRQGLAQGNISVPLPDGFDQPMDYLSDFRNLARVMAMEAELYTARGDYAAAFDDYATLLTFANESTRDAVLLNGLVGIAIEHTGSESLLNALEWSDAGSRDYEYLVDSLRYIVENPSRLGDTVVSEADAVYLHLTGDETNLAEFREVLLASQDPTGSAGDISDETVRAVFRDVLSDYDRMAEWLKIPYYEQVPVEDYLPETDNILNLTIFPAVERVRMQDVRNQAQTRGTLLAVGIEWYGDDNGAYPDSLDALVPEYLPELPIDPFTGKPFSYAPTEDGYTLYSAGPDMIDNGGLTHSQRGEPGTDLVLRGPGRQQ